MVRDVSAAVILQNHQILICRRPAHKSNPLLWEFPGGKREEKETLAECLVRECQEELGVQIEVGQELGEKIYSYPEITVHLHFFAATIALGTPIAREHQEILWSDPDHWKDLTFCPADEEFLKILEKNWQAEKAKK